MNQDTITPARILDLIATLDIAKQSLTRLQSQVESGDVDPAYAAGVVSDCIKLITNSAR